MFYSCHLHFTCAEIKDRPYLHKLIYKILSLTGSTNNNTQTKIHWQHLPDSEDVQGNWKFALESHLQCSSV